MTDHETLIERALKKEDERHRIITENIRTLGRIEGELARIRDEHAAAFRTLLSHGMTEKQLTDMGMTSPEKTRKQAPRRRRNDATSSTPAHTPKPDEEAAAG